MVKKSKRTTADITVSKTLSHQIRCTIGDTGGDGHEKTRSDFIRANLSAADIMIAYKVASEKLDLDPIDGWFSDYDEYQINEEEAQKLFDTFPDLMKEWNIEEPSQLNESVSWGYDCAIMEIVSWIVRTEIPDFKYEEYKIQTLNLGGYGLLS